MRLWQTVKQLRSELRPLVESQLREELRPTVIEQLRGECHEAVRRVIEAEARESAIAIKGAKGALQDHVEELVPKLGERMEKVIAPPPTRGNAR